MFFVSPKNFFLFWRHLNFCSDFFGYVEKRFAQDVKVNFKLYGVQNWETNKYNTDMAQYLKT